MSAAEQLQEQWLAQMRDKPLPHVNGCQMHVTSRFTVGCEGCMQWMGYQDIIKDQVLRFAKAV